MRFLKLPFFFASLLLALAVTAPSFAQTAAPAKKVVEKADDLPRHTYALTKAPSDVLRDDAAFATLAAAVKQDILSDLATYDIKDRSTLQRYLSTLLSFALLDHDLASARKLIDDLRTLEEKPSLKLTTGLVAEAWSNASLKRIAPDGFPQVFQADLSALLSRLPWDIVQDDLKQLKSNYEIRSETLILGLAKEQLDPAAAKSGEISGDIAGQLVGMKNQIVNFLPYKAAIVAALNSTINAHKTVKTDLWTPTLVKLSRWTKAKPVIIGIWDSGTDIKVYKKNLYTAEDGSHGFAYDLHSNPVPDLLFPLGELKESLPDMIDRLKGFTDVQASIDSPEATKLKQFLSTLKPGEVKPMIEDLNMIDNWAHGSHVTGIAIAGNPYARVLVGRITYDFHLVPEVPTLAQARKDAIATAAQVDVFKKAGVRVVNMSWGGSLKDVESALEASGAGGTAEERKKLARNIFDLGSDALYNAIKGAPDILFVAAAGNSDNNVKFDEFIPSSFQLPNMITVGAVDQAGEETAFSSFGPMVNVHANGFEVPSFIPGGQELKFSGTSMAAPQVTNLAGKLIALDPSLTPEATKELILDGCKKTGRVNLVNEAKSVGLLKEILASK